MVSYGSRQGVGKLDVLKRKSWKAGFGLYINLFWVLLPLTSVPLILIYPDLLEIWSEKIRQLLEHWVLKSRLSEECLLRHTKTGPGYLYLGDFFFCMFTLKWKWWGGGIPFGFPSLVSLAILQLSVLQHFPQRIPLCASLPFFFHPVPHGVRLSVCMHRFPNSPRLFLDVMKQEGNYAHWCHNKLSIDHWSQRWEGENHIQSPRLALRPSHSGTLFFFPAL